MKKLFDKKILVWFLGLFVLALELVFITFNLTNLNVLTYLLCIGFIPAIILFVTSLIYSSFANKTKLTKYVLAIVAALVFSAILLTFCELMISTETVNQIIENSMTSDTTQVSMNTATAGDNIQSILLYVAFSGVGCFIGTSIYKKKMNKNVSNNPNINEYD
ncbi:MAG: hypothetical protein GX625_02805 [Clostridiaceae bacterium]|nr:hypothetical protein [Clostridiaceae bacterium]